ncbi:hypothetical protein [Micromonospora sp. NPDC049799]|uniref:hypothetical protein n=1 Tax=Micromonospora sp. NPDC049799 TaxID=3154741 RepID=UPI0034045F76
MSEPGGDDLIFDQAGQQVDLQYNAASIKVVNQIADGRGGKRCPQCSAAPMRQTAIVWEESTRRVRNGTMVLNSLASRVAPPRRPRLRHRSFRVRPYLRPFVILLALWVFTSFLSNDLFLVGATVALIAAVLWPARQYLRFRADAAADRERVAKSSTRYERDRDLWRRSWFCGACGAIVVEKAPRQRNRSSSPAARPAGNQAGGTARRRR